MAIDGSLPVVAGIVSVLLIASGLATPSLADPPILGCTTCVVIVPSASFTQLGVYTLAQISVSNPQNTSATGLVYAIAHNSTGETVANETGVLLVAPSANSTTSILILGLTPGAEYAVTFFAVNVNGTAISMPYTASVTLTEGAPPSSEEAALGTGTLGAVAFPSCPSLAMPCESYLNNSNATVDAVAYFVLHNSLGQTIDVSSELLVLSAGQERLFTMPILHPHGMASEFAVSVHNFAISPLLTGSF